MNEALVTPEILTWARYRQGMGVVELSTKLNVRPEVINAWEEGYKRPTFRQAQRFAQALHIPFGYLFLSEPPIEASPVSNFLTTGSQAQRKPSPEFLDLFNDALAKQEWFREYKETEGTESLPFVGRFSLEATTEMVPRNAAGAVSYHMHQTIDADGAASRSANREELLRELTRNAERSGIMVMRSSVVGNNVHRPLNPSEFRGFALPDEIAPLIFLNARELIEEQVSTFAHELTHIWIGEGRVCGPTYQENSEEQVDRVEQFCDEVARESLERFVEDQGGMDALRMGKSRWLPSYSIGSSIQSVQPNERANAFCQILVARNGVAFTEAVVSSAAEGTLLSSEAANLLGIKVKTLPSIAKHLFGSPLSLG